MIYIAAFEGFPAQNLEYFFNYLDSSRGSLTSRIAARTTSCQRQQTTTKIDSHIKYSAKRTLSLFRVIHKYTFMLTFMIGVALGARMGPAIQVSRFM
jgi:hypothetical protein